MLRQLRYIFDLHDEQMIDLFLQADVKVTRVQVSNWLKKEEDEDFQEISDTQFASFLNGFINEKRGKREGSQIAPEKKLNNNIILRKIKIALQFQDTDILEVYKLAGVEISKHEISAFFRSHNQSQYRNCGDQFMRNFLRGLQYKYRPESRTKND